LLLVTTWAKSFDTFGFAGLPLMSDGTVPPGGSSVT
jgi:hypothetical protein